MKRAYEVKVERGDNWQAGQYVVIAATDEEAVRKAKRHAVRESGVQTGWRCVELRERSTELVG
jgi:hypothetical protein